MQSDKINIFYSWQSDSHKNTNQNFIREALRNTSTKLENEKNLIINIDEATRNLPGSPHIPSSIFKKIEDSDIFLCDLSIINPQAEERKVPNPNVLIELGYSISLLGWNRIIMLFNLTYGKLKDLPFDIDRHRASAYTYAEEDLKNKKIKISSLEQLLYSAFNSIIEMNPERPRFRKELNEKLIKQERDEDALKELLLEFHIPTFEKWIQDGPNIIPDSIFHFWEGFNEIVTSKEFYLYDKKLSKCINSIHKYIAKALSFDSEYELLPNKNRYKFTNPGDLPLPKDRKKNWDEIEEALNSLNIELEVMLSHIRNKYINIDIKLFNQRSWNKYIDNMKYIEGLLNR